jgi:hypothetical protein
MKRLLALGGHRHDNTNAYLQSTLCLGGLPGIHVEITPLKTFVRFALKWGVCVITSDLYMALRH